ncbi:MAG: hypothetical protein H0V07_06905 [Propionibacteriales bacterium]|nr:hypothetical protein [Propionibacteriales bacterium]
MDSTTDTVHVYVNPVQSDRADEWETFVRSVIVPVVSRQRPQLIDQVRVLRSEDAEDSTTTFVFLFRGGDIADYDLGPLFAAEYGDEEGERLLDSWQAMFAREQYGWTLHQIPLDL